MTRCCRLCDTAIAPRSGPGRPAVWCSEACRHEADLEVKRLTQTMRELERRRGQAVAEVARIDSALTAVRSVLAELTGTTQRKETPHA